jgi:RecA/RadA recombinase
MGAIIKRKISDVVSDVRETVESHADNDITFATRNISVDSVVSTGSTLLDLAISGKRRRGGGLPGGVLVEIFGPSGSGKTALLAEILAAIQSQGGDTQIQDPEGRVDKEYAKIYEVDIPEEIYSRPDTVEEVMDFIPTWRPRDPTKINGIGTDSLAALSTELEMSPKKDKMGMKRAKEFSGGFRRTCRLIANNKWLWVCTNQVRQGEYGEVTPGGNAIAFYASLRIRVKEEDKVEKEVTLSSGVKVKKVIGIQSSCYTRKSTIDDPYREAPIYIIFGYGIDDIRANLQWLKDMRKGSVYECPDGKTYQSLNMAIQYVEKQGLQTDLKEQVINLWEEIESKFNLDRPKKMR